MTTLQDVEHIYVAAKALLESKEEVYGDAWKSSGLDTCFEQIPRKTNYLRVQRKNGNDGSDKFLEDLLDLLNWCVLTYYFLEEERK